MAISFVEGTAGTLFNRLGKMGVLVDTARTEFRDGGDAQAELAAITDRLAGGDITPSGDVQDERDLLPLLTPTEILEVNGWMGRGAELQRLARRLLRRHLWRDTGRYERDGDDPRQTYLDLLELRAQMVAAPETLLSSTVSAPGAVPLTNVGNGSLLTVSKRGDGLATELQFAETGDIRCTRDGYTKLGLTNWEEFTYFGPQAVHGMHPDWGGTNRGSGTTGTLFQVIDPTGNADRGNMGVNGFEDFTNNIPNGWNKTVGVSATDFRSSSAQKYFGSNSLELMAGGGALTSFEQSFDDIVASYSTSSRPQGSTQYALYLRHIKPSGTITAGTAIVEWIDSAGAVLADDQGVNNTTTIDLTTLTTAWTTTKVAFRSPKTIGTGSKIRIRLSVALAGANCFLDSFAFGRMTECYPGGPWIALAAGSTPFSSALAAPDNFTLAATNDNGGATHARKTWHRYLDALYGLREMGILFPTGAGSIANSAIG